MTLTPSDHDLLIELRESISYIKMTLDDIKEGKSQSCIAHTSQISELWRNTRALWAVVSTVALLVVGNLIEHIAKTAEVIKK